MRIISGIFKSRLIKSGKNIKNLRPTTDRARESLFNILSNHIELNNKTCLDLFCGTGSFGLECISRGAGKAYFVDKRIDIVKKNVDALKVFEKSFIIKKDVVLFLKSYCESDFVLAFADPPYIFKRYDELLREILRFKVLFVLEHSGDLSFEEDYRKEVFLKKKFGITNFTFFDFR
jgi:16S rRNA (guanine966-N2)-methyltransferase